MSGYRDYIKSLLRTALKESVMQNDIVDAISKKHEVDITYNDGADGYRRIQPVKYGVSKKGNLVISAYQTRGASETDTTGWKEFIVDKIGAWRPDKSHSFPEPPTNPSDGAYNPNRDDNMQTVYLKADFGQNSPVTAFSQPQRANVQPQQQNTQQGQIQAPVEKDSNIAGIGPERTNPSNAQSIGDMQRSRAAMNAQKQPTSGPAQKDNDEETDTQLTGQEEYAQAYDNGPQLK